MFRHHNTRFVRSVMGIRSVLTRVRGGSIFFFSFLFLNTIMKFSSFEARLFIFFSQLFSFLFIYFINNWKCVRIDSEQLSISCQVRLSIPAMCYLSKWLIERCVPQFRSRFILQEMPLFQILMSYLDIYYSFLVWQSYILPLLPVWATHSGERAPIMLIFLF